MVLQCRWPCVVARRCFFRHRRNVNQTTIALIFLLAILAVSAVWGMAVSVFMSVAAVLAINYFFLPPVGTFHESDPQNWVALFSFSSLPSWEAGFSQDTPGSRRFSHQHHHEIERLYKFSQKLLTEGNVIN